MGNSQNKSKLDESFTIIAHRGSSKKYPENSLQSLKQAVKDNIKYIEIDVIVTFDNRIILQHDIIKNNTDYLASDAQYNNELLLETVFKELPKDITYVIDLKDPRPKSNLVNEVLKICNQFKCINRCIFASFNIFHLVDLNNYEIETGHKLNKAFSTGNLEIDFFKDKILTYGLTHLILYKFQITPKVITFIKNNHNIKIFVYTCNTKELFNYCLRCGVDGLFSDNPEKFIRKINYFDNK
jgi:glycerophosphoryl diester phosphodiesterase